MIERSLGESARCSFRIRPMLKLEFTDAEKQVLHYERYHHPHPRVRQKMEVLWLKSQGLPHREIARLAGVSENTLRSYLQEYVQGGLVRLREVCFHRPQSELAAHRASLEGYFRAHPPATVNEARAKIAELTGLTRSPTQIRQFLKRCGMRCRKTGVLPAKGDPDEQAAYQKKSWNLASPRRGRGRGRSSSWTRLTSCSGPLSGPCGVLPGSGSRRPADAAASMSWVPSTR